MKISTDNGIMRKRFGDLKAAEMIHEAGFDGIDYTFYEMDEPEEDLFAREPAEWKRIADEVIHTREYLPSRFRCSLRQESL